MNIKNYNVQTCLYEYFAVLLVGRPHDRARVFDRMRKIFLVPEEDGRALYELTENDKVTAISSESGYGRYCRTKSYLETAGKTAIAADEPTDAVATVKGSVISALAQIKCAVSADRSDEELLFSLRRAAEAGSVLAMRVLAFMNIEGIALSKDVAGGLNRLRLVGDWNCVPALAMLLYYEPERVAQNLDALALVADDLAIPDLMSNVKRVYGAPRGGADENRLILESGFKSGTLSREMYSPLHARTVYSKILSAQSKRNLLNAGNAFTALVGDLPLDFEFGAELKTDARQLARLPFRRDKEIKAVERWLENSDLRGMHYRPLGFCSDSMYMLDAYAAALDKCMSGANAVRIDVRETEACYFMPTKNNIFLRSCRPDKANVYFIYVCGEIEDEKLDRIKSFLCAANRRRFMLDSPSITLDLGDVMPVCFFDNGGAAEIGGMTDTVYIATPTREERLAMISGMLKARAKAYGIPRISLKKGAADYAAELSVDVMECVLDGAVRAHRTKGENLSLSVADLAAENDEISSHGFGFGGYDGHIR